MGDEASEAATAARLGAMSLIFEDASLARPEPGSTRRDRPAARLADYVALTKPRVMSLVVFTAVVGLVVAPAHIHPATAIGSVLCIAAGAGAAGALNMWYDADIDAVMTRTASRPIPAGRVSGAEARTLGLVLAVISVTLLGLIANWLAASLLAFTIAFYVVIYTMWLKRMTPQNIVIGGAAGAFPPLIGWAASAGSISVEPIVLCCIIFFWTPPHFWALALWRIDDYARAGVPMLPVVAGADETRRQILIYSLMLAPLGVLPWLIGRAGPVYGMISVLAGAILLGLALRVRCETNDKAAKQLFGFSIVYLFVLFAVLLLGSIE